MGTQQEVLKTLRSTEVSSSRYWELSTAKLNGAHSSAKPDCIATIFATQEANRGFCLGFLRFLICRPCLKQLQAGFFVVQFEFFTMQFEFFTMQIEPFTMRLEFYARQTGPSFVTRDR